MGTVNFTMDFDNMQTTDSFTEDMIEVMFGKHTTSDYAIGCEYCNNGKFLYNAFDNYYKAHIGKRDAIWITLKVNGKDSILCGFPINYCPMCGRKLSE